MADARPNGDSSPKDAGRTSGAVPHATTAAHSTEDRVLAAVTIQDWVRHKLGLKPYESDSMVRRSSLHRTSNTQRSRLARPLFTQRQSYDSRPTTHHHLTPQRIEPHAHRPPFPPTHRTHTPPHPHPKPHPKPTQNPHSPRATLDPRCTPTKKMRCWCCRGGREGGGASRRSNIQRPTMSSSTHLMDLSDSLSNGRTGRCRRRERRPRPWQKRRVRSSRGRRRAARSAEAGL